MNRVKIIVAKGEIARLDKFRLLLQCFQKLRDVEQPEFT